MQDWQIIVASAVAASIAAAALFLPEVVRPPSGAATLFQTYWSGVIIVWLGVYGVAALVLSTAAAVREFADIASGQAASPDWPRRYLLRLGSTQYFSAVLVLFALGLLPLPVTTVPFSPVSTMIGASPALTACAAAILAGVLGWLSATIIAAFRTSPVRAEILAGPDTKLLREMIELLRARPVEPFSATPDLAEQLRQRDRSTLEAIKELAGAVNRIRNGVSEIQNGLQQRGPDRTDAQSSSAALADVAEAGRELRSATAAVLAAVTKLDDVAAGLAAFSPIGISAPPRGNLPPGSRSQLSTELQELLRDIATGPGPAPRQEGSR